MPVVSVVKSADADLKQVVASVLEPFTEAVSCAGASVLIKPNLVEPEPYETGQTTNPALVEAIIGWCRDQGAADIAVGEGPSFFQPRSALRDCFTRTGTADAADRCGVPWILFDEDDFETFEGYSEATPNVFHLSRHAFAWDRIINVPVPKTHYLTMISSAMKNLKGFIRREDKPSFHHCGPERIHGSVTALNGLIRPALNIIDFTAPTHRNAQCVLAGTDIVAVDAVVASLMGYNPDQIQTIALGHREGLGEMDLSRIDILGDEIKNLHMNFEQPENYVKRVFPQIILEAEHACSGCLIPLFAALHRLEGSGLTPSGRICILCGQQELSDAPEAVLCIGQCAKQYRDRFPWLKGCPPTKEELYCFLADRLS